MFEAILKITDKFQGYHRGQQEVLKSSKRLLTKFEVIRDFGEILRMSERSSTSSEVVIEIVGEMAIK